MIFVRQGLSFSFSLLDLYSDYVGANISLNHFSSLSFLDVYAPLNCFSLTDNRIDSASIFSSRYLFILGDFNCHQQLWDSKGTSEPCGKKIFNCVISFGLLFLHNPYITTLLHCSSGSRSSSDISFEPLPFSSLAPRSCFRNWVLITYQYY